MCVKCFLGIVREREGGIISFLGRAMEGDLWYSGDSRLEDYANWE